MAYCTRAEHAGTLPLHSSSGAYAHKLSGKCKCGNSHGAAASSESATKSEAETGAKSEAKAETESETFGLTLEQYAKAKALPVPFLESLGLRTVQYLNRPAVSIPFPPPPEDPLGRVQILYRIAMSGPDRFRWKYGSRPILYGLPVLREAYRVGYLVLTEGPSDVQTIWWHGVPALGLPGAAVWKQEWDAYLVGDDGHDTRISTVFVVAEPDTGGHKMLARLAATGFADRVRVVRLGTYKDISDLHLAIFRAYSAQGEDTVREQFCTQWEAALDAATPLDPALIAQSGRIQGPTIDAGDLCLPRVTQAAWQALIAANEPPMLFRRGNLLVRLEMNHEPEVRPTHEAEEKETD